MKILDRFMDKLANKIVYVMLPHIQKTCEQQEYCATVFNKQLFISKGSDIFVRSIDRILEMK